MLSLLGNGTLAAIIVFITLGLAVGHLLRAEPQEDQKSVLAFASATRHPVIALMIGKANFPDEPLLGPTILLYPACEHARRGRVSPLGEAPGCGLRR